MRNSDTFFCVIRYYVFGQPSVFQNIAMLMFTIFGLVAVISTFFWSECVVIAYLGNDYDFVSITLHSAYNYVTLYISNCYDTTPSSLKNNNMHLCKLRSQQM